MKNKGLAVLLAVVFGLMLWPAQAKASAVSYLSQARVMQELGMFTGTENGYELERMGTRAEAAVMLVRLMGQEKNLDREAVTPFTDVPNWAAPYVAMLMAHDIHLNLTDNQFGGTQPLTPTQYAECLLKILGYDNLQGDYLTFNTLGKMQELGIIQSGDMEELDRMPNLTRGGLVSLSYQTLFAGFKEAPSVTLLEKLYLNDGVVSAASLVAASAYNGKVAEIAKGLRLLNDTVTVLSTQEIARRVSPAVFYLITYDAAGTPIKSGSGFFIEATGTAVTNFHVIQGAASAQIQTADGVAHNVQGVLAYDEKLDLALLQVEGNDFTPVELGDSDRLETGEKVYSISSPLGFSNTFSEGIVSNVARWMDSIPYIQMTVPISTGSSGGVLLNDKAQAVGIITALVQDGQSLNFALPVKLLSNLSERNLRSLGTLAPITAPAAPAVPETQSVPTGPLVYEEEPNNTWPTANFLNGSSTAVGALDYWKNDMDYYQFLTIVPGTAYLTLLGDSGEPNSLALLLARVNSSGNTEGIAFADYVETVDGNSVYLLQYNLDDPGDYYAVVYPYRHQGQQEGDVEAYVLDYQFFNNYGI